MQTADGTDSSMDPVLRETWDVLMSDGEQTNQSATNEAEAGAEEKVVVVSKPQLWPQAMQPQQQLHHHHHHHHEQEQEPAQEQTNTHCEEHTAELTEEQEQQLEHSSRTFQDEASAAGEGLASNVS